MATAEKLSAKQAAIQLNTDARTLRKFLRASDEFDAVGQGNRYEFDSKEMKKLKKSFAAWSGKKTKTEKRAPEPETEDIVDETTGDLVEDDNSEPAEVEWTDDADADLEAIEGPDDEELEALEAEIEEVDLDDA